MGKLAVEQFYESDEFKAIKILATLNDLDINSPNFFKGESHSLYSDTNFMHLLDPRESIYDIDGQTAKLEEAIASGEISLNVECHLRHSILDFKLSNTTHVDVKFTDDQLAILEETLIQYKAYKREKATYEQALKDTSEVDAHMDKVEAQLLMRELNSSDEGKEVLKLTEQILQADTGTALPLLQAK
jgi:hypothetical protein